MISPKEDNSEEPVASDNKAVEPKEPVKPLKKGRLKLILSLILIALIAGGLSGGGVYLWQKNKADKSKAIEKPISEEVDKKEVPKEEENTVYVNSLMGLNMRKSASLTAEIVTILKYAAKLTAEKEEGSFYFGKDEKGNEGYFAKEFTSKIDPMSEWITYNGKNYTVKYPKDWLKKVCEDSGYTGFGPDEKELQVCNSEGSALVSINTIEETKANYISNTKTGLDTFKEINIKVSGADAVRVEGVTKEVELGPVKGSKSIAVIMEIGPKILVLSYLQGPNETDYSDIFDLMVQNFSLAG